MARRSAVVAFLAATLLLLVPAGVPPAAAAEELRLAADTTYTLDPGAGVVHVTIDITATNLKPNGTQGDRIITYYWDQLGFGIQREATGVRATSAGRRLTVSTEAEEGFSSLTVRLANRLTFRETQRVRIQYDLVGGEPRSESSIRVGRAFASFYAWAWGDPGRASVTVNIPAGFDENVNGGDVTRSTADGAVRLRATAIDEPQEWFITVDAERPSQLTRDPIVVMGGARITVQSWPEDDEWRAKVHDLMADGLPLLQRFIGLDWPVAGELNVVEVHTPLLEGYAGVYYTDRERIEIGEDLDDLTIVHEAAHAWFNDDLFTLRWITEGMADEYAWQVLDELGIEVPGPRAVTPDGAGTVALNRWTHPGRIEDDETDARETFGYNASWTVLRELIDEIGIDGMEQVIAAADADETAYRGEGAPERVTARDDWRRFLDLLVEVGGSEQAEALFREWVVDGGQVDLLDRRAEAREAYAALVEAGDGWAVPWSVRSKLSGWDFTRAGSRIAEAETVLDARDTLVERAGALGVSRSERLEEAYESAMEDLDEAEAIAAEEAISLDALDAATAALARERDALTALGLWNEPLPEDRYAAATAAFSADAHALAVSEADAARAIVDAAPQVGRSRATTAGIAGGGLLLVGGTIVVVRRRRRGGRGPTASAGASAAAGAVAAPAAPYATLAAQSPAPGAAPDPHPVAEAPATPDPASSAPAQRGADPT